MLGRQLGVFKGGGAAAVEGHAQGHQEDEQGAAGGVEDELGGGVLAPLAAPDGQQQIHRNQLQFPGQEEQQHVLDRENRDLAPIHGQQQEIEQLGFEAHRPCGQARQGGDKAGEQDQRHREPVSTDGPSQAQLRKPGDGLAQLQASDGGVVAADVGPHRDQEGDQGNAKGVPAHRFAVTRIRDQGDEQ